jgi:acyl carrier protein
MDSVSVDTMICFLKEKILRNPNADIHKDTPLVSSGRVDSFALMEVLVELERITNLRIPAMKVTPARMDTVTKMFETAAEIGVPSKG